MFHPQEREIPKVKKLSKLKKAICFERAIRKGQREGEDVVDALPAGGGVDPDPMHAESMPDDEGMVDAAAEEEVDIEVHSDDISKDADLVHDQEALVMRER